MTALATHRPTALPVRPRRVAGHPRLTVRWDRVALVVALLLAFVWFVGGFGTGQSQAVTAPAAPVVVVVQPGDTLWQLAREHAPSGMATLEYVMLIEDVNEVRAGVLLPGTPLQLPQA